MDLSKWQPSHKTDFFYGLAALAVLITAFFLLGGTNLFYHLDPMLAVLGFLAVGVIFFTGHAYFGEKWGR